MSPLVMHYEVDGAAEVRHKMLRMEARALDVGLLLRAFADQLRGIERDLFESGGAGAWAPLAASTIARKGHGTVLRDTDALFDSLTDKGAEGALEEVFGNELLFGTNLTDDDGTYYAGFLRSGTSRMPARDPLPGPTATDMRRFTKAVQAWLIGTDRAGFGVGSFGMGLTTPFGA